MLDERGTAGYEDRSRLIGFLRGFKGKQCAQLLIENDMDAPCYTLADRITVLVYGPRHRRGTPRDPCQADVRQAYLGGRGGGRRDARV